MFSKPFLVGVLCFYSAYLLSCSSVKNATGYHLVKQRIDKDAADRLRAKILSAGNDLFVPSRYTGSDGITINYRLLSPVITDPKRKYPLVLVLHGSGAVGTDNNSQLGVLAKLWVQPLIREQYPAYVLAPQFPKRSSNYTLDPDKNVLAAEPDPSLADVLHLLDSLKQVLPIEEGKIYVTGFSMGASTAINALELRPDLFAGAIAVSGIPAFNRITTLVNIPLWIIHGNADQENAISSDKQFYKEMSALHNRHITFWEVEGYGHDIYPGLYEKEAIPQWLFRQLKPLKAR